MKILQIKQEMVEKKIHKSVLTDEVNKALRINALLNTQARIIDATLDGGGHSLEFIKRGILVLGIDADEEMLEVAKKRISKACPALDSRQTPILINGNFRDIDTIAQSHGFVDIDGILFDLGISTEHFFDKRGFSYKKTNEPLDMRIDTRKNGVKAKDLLNVLREDQLIDLFSEILEWGMARKIAKEVVRIRDTSRYEKVADFVRVVKKVIKRPTDSDFAKIFLALRIAVNTELENLEIALPKAFSLLKKGGRLVVISFHSGEDAIVKNYFKNLMKDGKAKTFAKGPIMASSKEVLDNPKARSAKLRFVEKI